MTRATNELRRMLDERGVKYQTIGKTLTYWNRDGSDNECDDADFVADERPDGTLTVEGLTPEQAIAATLRSGKCRIEWRDDSHDTPGGYEHDGAYYCTGCGKDLPDWMQSAWDDYQARYGDAPFAFTPCCGREVQR